MATIDEDAYVCAGMHLVAGTYVLRASSSISAAHRTPVPLADISAEISHTIKSLPLVHSPKPVCAGPAASPLRARGHHHYHHLWLRLAPESDCAGLLRLGFYKVAAR